MPETLTLACDIIHALAPELMRDPTQQAIRSLGTVYGEVRQHFDKLSASRWVVVYSPHAYQRARKTVDKHCLKQSSAELKGFDKPCKEDFACEADARNALAAFEKKLKMSVVVEPRIEALPRFKGKGRPAQGREPDFHVYRITGALASLVKERTHRLERKSCFILATNQLDCQALSDEELIAAYKDQQKVERGFRFLKDPLFMASTLYLKSPERIMALMLRQAQHKCFDKLSTSDGDDPVPVGLCRFGIPHPRSAQDAQRDFPRPEGQTNQ